MKKVELKKFDNSNYNPGSFLKRIAWFIFGRIFINTYLPLPMSLKILILRSFGTKIGSNVTIKPKVNIKYPWFLEIGSNVWIGECAWIDNLAMVRIESNVCISQDAMLLTGNHDYKSVTFDMKISPIIIEDGAWVGAKSIVCPGVIMKTHSILSVNSVLSNTAEPYMIYRGNPALPVKNREITN
jgi:putative colanic acid biosynthesis acetyltransferase WcaF